MSAAEVYEPASFVLEATGGRPLTINQVAKMHRQAWASHTRITREEWWALALQARLPRMQRAVVEVTPLHQTFRSPQDVAACAPAAKAAIDGLVTAGVLPDDNPEHLLAVTFLPPDVCGVDGLRIRITKVAA